MEPLHDMTGGGANGPHPLPLPPDAPLLTFEQAGAYLGLSAGAVRKIVDRAAEDPDEELGQVLRSNLVRLSPRRRFIKRAPFLSWLQSKAGTS